MLKTQLFIFKDTHPGQRHLLVKQLGEDSRNHSSLASCMPPISDLDLEVLSS